MDGRWPEDAVRGGRPLPEPMRRRVGSFLAALGEAAWLTEHPDSHLGPKLDAWLAGHPEWRVDDRRTSTDGTWEVSVRLSGSIARSPRDRRAAVVALVGAFAEDVVVVEEECDAPQPRYLVLTGQRARNGLRAHGHAVRLDLV